MEQYILITRHEVVLYLECCVTKVLIYWEVSRDASTLQDHGNEAADQGDPFWTGCVEQQFGVGVCRRKEDLTYAWGNVILYNVST